MRRPERSTFEVMALNCLVFCSVMVVSLPMVALTLPEAVVSLVLAVTPIRPPKAATASDRAEVPPEGTEVVASTVTPPASMLPVLPMDAVTEGLKVVLGRETPTAARPAA